jgi:signal transduction histidine kinase
MARLILERDWGRTPLGPIEDWSEALLRALELILHSEFQLAVYWGPELVLLYNDAERAPLGDAHPEALGQPARDVLGEIWDDVGSLLEGVLATGRPTWSEDAPLTRRRWGMTEEAFYTWSYSPIFGDRGVPEGVLLVTTETTRRVLGERRLRTLYALASKTANQRSVEEVWQESVDALVEDPDIFAAELHVVAGGAPTCAASAARSGRSEPLQRVSPLSIGNAVLAGEAVIERLEAPAVPALLMPFRINALAPAVPVLVLYLSPLRRLERGEFDYTELLVGKIAAAASDAAAFERERDRLREEAAGQERKRIERDLHDSIQRQLVGARLVTELTRGVTSNDPVRADRLLAELSAQLLTASAELRQIITGRYPSLLSTQGLVAAVRASAERARLTVTVEGEIGRFDPAAESELYHAVIEAIQNAFKHAGQGCRVGVRFRRRGDTVAALVHDSGVGFDSGSVVRGQGLRNMEERLQALGGTCRVRSTLGRGTSVRFRLPVRR